jgi:protein-S-isoprenylcysteine O-methyltransferase Ste14
MDKLENRIPPPLVALFCGIAMWVVARVMPVHTLSLVVVGVLVVLGVFFCAAGVVSFRLAKTTVNPLKPELASALVTSGIYRITRNPMYLGFALLLCAWASFLGSVWAASFIVLYVLFIQRFQIQPEERALQGIFGETFSHYKQDVRTWL